MGNKAPAPAQPGKFGNSENTAEVDTRLDERLVEVLKTIGMAGKLPPPKIKNPSTKNLKKIHEELTETETGFNQLSEAMVKDLPPIVGVERTIETIKGVDGNDIKVYVTKPKNMSGPAAPCVCFFHGGGFAILSVNGAAYKRFQEELAARGVVVVAPEYRNTSGALGNTPFPGGLRDCVSTIEWAHANKKTLNASKILTCGDSAGGNLAISTVLKLKAEGKTSLVSGIFSINPFISGKYTTSAKECKYLSLYENDGLFMNTDGMRGFLVPFENGQDLSNNELAWPSNASVEDLKGMPPTVIQVNECDPLRDEGLAFNWKLRKAKVPGYATNVCGLVHCAEILFPNALPEPAAALYNAVVSFAKEYH